MIFPVWIHSFVRSIFFLLFFVPGIPLDLCLLGVVLGWGRREDPELAEQPGDPIRGLGADAQPVLEAILLEADLLHPISVGDWVVGSQYLQELAVPGGPGVGGDHPVKRGMGPAEALQPEADNHISLLLGFCLFVCLAVCSEVNSTCRRVASILILYLLTTY
jgi:hypothetical protein